MVITPLLAQWSMILLEADTLVYDPDHTLVNLTRIKEYALLLHSSDVPARVEIKLAGTTISILIAENQLTAPATHKDFDSTTSLLKS
jgi:hypothetical protein